MKDEYKIYYTRRNTQHNLIGKALKLHKKGMNNNQIAIKLKTSPQNVGNWINAIENKQILVVKNGTIQ